MKRFITSFLLILSLTGCGYFNPQLPDNAIILAEAMSELGHYTKYTDGNTVYIFNNETGDKAEVYLQNGSIIEALRVEIDKDTKMKLKGVDPRELNIGIEYDIPCTYISNLQQSSIYISSLLESGWSVTSKYINGQYLDYRLTKCKENIRVIVFKDKLKVFQGIYGKTEDPFSYINE